MFAAGAAFGQADELWLEDAPAAVALAKEGHKDLLLLYTGSDWCPPCKKLEEEVLADERFAAAVRERFVLLKLDFPKQLEQSDQRKEQNAEWAARFGVAGYPTVVLTDSELVPYAITGYEAGGVENYLGNLEAFWQKRVERDRLLTAAQAADGKEKAALIDQALSLLDETMVSVYYQPWVEQIVSLDADDALGLRSKWNAAKDAELRKVVMADILMVSRLERPDRALAFIDEVIAEIQFPPAEMLDLMQIKLGLVRKLDDHQALDQLLDEMIHLEGVEGDTQERLIVKKVFLMVGTGRRSAAEKLLDDSIAAGGSNLRLYLAKGELLATEGKHREAIEAFDRAMASSGGAPDIMIDLVSAKADSLAAVEETVAALQLLDNFADDAQWPLDLRCEALLHKAMIMRDSGRGRQARLAENRAIELAGSAQEKAEVQKLVDRLRKKYDARDDG